jgi:hypothetical protein
VTDSRSHDRAAALPLLEEIDAELQTFFGDGAYDQQKVYDALERRDACAVIPPRRRAKESTRANSSRDRNEAIRQMIGTAAKPGRSKVAIIAAPRGSGRQSSQGRILRTTHEPRTHRPKKRSRHPLQTAQLVRPTLLGMPLSMWI